MGKLVLEKAACLKVDVEIADLPAHPPQERDSWLMWELVRLNYNSKDLRRVNCMQVHQEALFLLDIMAARGQIIDRKYLKPRPMCEAWSTLTILIKQPAAHNLKLWRVAIPQI
jgi:hypothetical protein